MMFSLPFSIFTGPLLMLDVYLNHCWSELSNFKKEHVMTFFIQKKIPSLALLLTRGEPGFGRWQTNHRVHILSSISAGVSSGEVHPERDIPGDITCDRGSTTALLRYNLQTQCRLHIWNLLWTNSKIFYLKRYFTNSN